MNEQDIILREKIEKREKFDTILAYILLVILLGAIALVVILKLTRKEDNNIATPEEYIPTYISLAEISNSLNNIVFNDYSITSSLSGNSIVITYEEGNNINIPMVGNELMVTIEQDNKNITTTIYKEIGSIICKYYGNEEKYCRNTIENMSEEGNDSIRIVNNDNNIVVYIDTTKSYTVNTEIVYNNVTEVAINETNYILNMLDVKISNITVVSTDDNIVFSSDVEKLNDSVYNFDIMVRIYDFDGNMLEENKYEYNETNVLEGIGTFEVEFLSSDTLNLEEIVKYSIEVIR